MVQVKLKYRPNVAGILRNIEGRILICERINMDGAWQFPQGGVDEGETDEEALVRELNEEIGVSAGDYRIVEKRGPYRYLFGAGRLKHGCHGTEQHYFLAEFLGKPSAIDLEAHKPEFQDHRWIFPREFRLEWLPEMKREVYRAVFADFFGVKF